MNGVIAKRLALNMALMCVRNTCIEDIHAGLEPSSKAGDFSDVKLITPYGEIPWNKLSRIRNDEMREFMKQVAAVGVVEPPQLAARWSNSQKSEREFPPSSMIAAMATFGQAKIGATSAWLSKDESHGQHRTSPDRSTS